MKGRIKAFLKTIVIVFCVNFILNCAYFGLDQVIGDKMEGVFFLILFAIAFFVLYRIVYESQQRNNDW
jgi:hypothetical protein